MQVYEGYVENGRFYPIGITLRTKSRQRAILTILNEPPITTPITPFYQLMNEAGKDPALLARTLECQEDFTFVEMGEW